MGLELTATLKKFCTKAVKKGKERGSIIEQIMTIIPKSLSGIERNIA